MQEHFNKYYLYEFLKVFKQLVIDNIYWLKYSFSDTPIRIHTHILVKPLNLSNCKVS